MMTRPLMPLPSSVSELAALRSKRLNRSISASRTICSEFNSPLSLRSKVEACASERSMGSGTSSARFAASVVITCSGDSPAPPPPRRG